MEEDLQLTPDNLFLLRRLLDQIQFFAVMPIELCIVQVGTSDDLERFIVDLCDFGSFVSVAVTIADDLAGVDRALSAAAKASIGDYVMFLRPNVIVYRGFDYFLHKTFLNNPKVLALTTLTTLAGDAHRAKYEREPLDGVAAERAAYQLINWHRGETIGDFKSPTAPAAVIFRRALLPRMPDSFLTGLAGLANSGYLKVAASVYCTFIAGAAVQQALDYLRARPPDRRALAVEALKSGIFAIFPDVALRLLKDLVKAGARAAELSPVVDMAAQGRRSDVVALKEIRTAVALLPSIARSLDDRIKLVETFKARVSADRR